MPSSPLLVAGTTWEPMAGVKLGYCHISFALHLTLEVKHHGSFDAAGIFTPSISWGRAVPGQAAETEELLPSPLLGPVVSIHSREQFPVLLLLLQQQYSVLLAQNTGTFNYECANSTCGHSASTAASKGCHTWWQRCGAANTPDPIAEQWEQPLHTRQLEAIGRCPSSRAFAAQAELRHSNWQLFKGSTSDSIKTLQAWLFVASGLRLKTQKNTLAFVAITIHKQHHCLILIGSDAMFSALHSFTSKMKHKGSFRRSTAAYLKLLGLLSKQLTADYPRQETHLVPLYGTSAVCRAMDTTKFTSISKTLTALQLTALQPELSFQTYLGTKVPSTPQVWVKAPAQSSEKGSVPAQHSSLPIACVLLVFESAMDKKHKTRPRRSSQEPASSLLHFGSRSSTPQLFLPSPPAQLLLQGKEDTSTEWQDLARLLLPPHLMLGSECIQPRRGLTPLAATPEASFPTCKENKDYLPLCSGSLHTVFPTQILQLWLKESTQILTYLNQTRLRPKNLQQFKTFRAQPCGARLCCCPVCQQRHLTSSWLSILIPGAKKAATAMQDSLAELPGWGKGILLHRPAFPIAATTTDQAGLSGQNSTFAARELIQGWVDGNAFLHLPHQSRDAVGEAETGILMMGIAHKRLTCCLLCVRLKKDNAVASPPPPSFSGGSQKRILLGPPDFLS
ncbi:hypothetical protein Anapl_00848 [Anas platyrhynchos]|uniref:Uncharacterized protein n=1 Tax=Anas platyrhynchos TaxID=8839 RepID=R0LX57_ANAPL|nr:hypothetical protein Anapl_00848 [Anas platyrhynchos]